MRAGRLRHRVTIQRVVETRDSYGAVVLTWGDLSDRWASIEPLRGRELYTAQQVNPEVTHTVRLRYLAGDTLGPKDRIKFGTRHLNVSQVLNVDERNREQVLLCEEAI